MQPDIVLAKCITLLYRESQLEAKTENSADLIRTTVEKIYIGENELGMANKKGILIGLRDFVLELCKLPVSHQYELTELLQQIQLVTNGDTNLYNSIKDAITQDLQPVILKRNITNLKKSISEFFREMKLKEILSRASRDFSFNRQNIRDVGEYINNLILELEITSSKASSKDLGIVKSMDFSDDDSVKLVFNDVADSNTANLPFRTGHRELNEALQGGPRPGDSVVVAALQHNYKTGFTLGLFADIVVENKPKCKDPTKKPLAYRITAEDPLRNNAQFLYQKFKSEETGEAVDIKNVTVDEMVSYVKKKLSVNGYQVIMDEVNPTTWTYQSIINRIIQLESMGYVVEILCIDYLSKFSTEGCNQGAIGDDVMDLLMRVRAYCSSNSILFVTPHQLSTEAKRLLQTVPQDQFLHKIKGGGFFEKTKGLDRIYDIGILLHKIELPNDAYLHCVIDKHRFPSVVDASLKSFYLKFPSNKMPIPNNLRDENYKVLRKVPKVFASSVPSDEHHDYF